MPEPERDGNPTGSDRVYAAEAQAALMLVESLMLVLIERRAIPAADLVEAVETVIETKRQLAAEGREPAVAAQAAAMLTTIANSLAAAAPPAER